MVTVAALPVLVGCGSGGSRAAAPAASPTALSDAQIQVLINDLVQCLRENGVPGMPDVRVQNGRVLQPDEAGVDEATKRNFESALEACKSVKDRIPDSVFSEGQQDSQRDTSERRQPSAQDVPALRKFAECMRQNGVPEWPDPKGDGSFPASAPLNREGKSPRVVAGLQACQQYWDGQLFFTP
jgi:hypothetical protein